MSKNKIDGRGKDIKKGRMKTNKRIWERKTNPGTCFCSHHPSPFLFFSFERTQEL